MPTPVQFTPGQFQTFRATIKLHLGQFQKDIFPDTEFEYDGVTLKVAGETLHVPNLKGAVAAGWMVPATDTTSQYVPQPAGVQVHAAESTGRERQPVRMAAASQEETVAGTVAASNTHRDNPRLRAAQQAQAAQAQMAAPAQQPVYPQPPQPQRPNVAQPQRPPVQVQAPPPQAHGNPKLPPPPRPGNLEEANAYNAAVLALALDSDAEMVEAQKQAGITLYSQRHDKIDDEAPATRVGGGKFGLVTTDAQQGDVIGSVRGSRLAAHVGREDEAVRGSATNMGSVSGNSVIASMVPQTGVVHQPPPKRQNVGAQVIPEREGISLPPVSVDNPSTHIHAQGNVGIDAIHADSHAVGDVAEAQYGDELADLIPDAAVAGYAHPAEELAVPGVAVAKPAKPKLSPEEKAAAKQAEIEEICAEWDTGRHWKKRVTEAVEMYGDDPEILEAIYGIESKGVVKHIKSGLARPK